MQEALLGFFSYLLLPTTPLCIKCLSFHLKNSQSFRARVLLTLRLASSNQPTKVKTCSILKYTSKKKFQNHLHYIPHRFTTFTVKKLSQKKRKKLSSCLPLIFYSLKTNLYSIKDSYYPYFSFMWNTHKPSLLQYIVPCY